MLNLLKLYMLKACLFIGEPKFLFGQIVERKDVVSLQNDKLSYISYRATGQHVSSGLDPNLYSFHSCQSGGASTLASKVTQFELMNCGRWKSARSIAHYVKLPDKRKLQFSKILSL